MKIWKCGVCGYLHDGDDAPEKCPKCGAPKEQFSQLTSEAAEMVSKSRRTNDIHMNLEHLLNKVSALCVEGATIKLDPTCVAIFERGVEAAHTLKQQIKAEIQGHVNKGKWG